MYTIVHNMLFGYLIWYIKDYVCLSQFYTELSYSNILFTQPSQGNQAGSAHTVTVTASAPADDGGGWWRVAGPLAAGPAGPASAPADDGARWQVAMTFLGPHRRRRCYRIRGRSAPSCGAFGFALAG